MSKVKLRRGRLARYANSMPASTSATMCRTIIHAGQNRIAEAGKERRLIRKASSLVEDPPRDASPGG